METSTCDLPSPPIPTELQTTVVCETLSESVRVSEITITSDLSLGKSVDDFSVALKADNTTSTPRATTEPVPRHYQHDTPPLLPPQDNREPASITETKTVVKTENQVLQTTETTTGVTSSTTMTATLTTVRVLTIAPKQSKLEAISQYLQSLLDTGENLNDIFQPPSEGGIDLKEIFDLMKMDDYKERHYLRVRAMELLCRTILPQLSIKARAYVAQSMYPKRLFGSFTDEEQKWFASIFLGARGADLTELKNRVDFHGKYKNIHKIVFGYLIGQAQTILLQHISCNLPVWKERHSIRSLPPIKILSDIDDTLKCSGSSGIAGVDARFTKGEPYPGVFAFYRELDIGSEKDVYNSETNSSNLAFVTARMHTPGGLTEEMSYKTFAQFVDNRKLHTEPILLAGDMGSTHILWSNYAPSAKKKVDNFFEYSKIYPEYNFVFVGDNGQGDYKAGLDMLSQSDKMLEVFIHAVQPIEKTWGLDTSHEKSTKICFFETYVGAALEAWKVGLISARGLVRVIMEAKTDLLGYIFRTMPDFPNVQTLKKPREVLREQQLRDDLNARILEFNADVRRSNYLLPPELHQGELEF